MHGGQTRLRMSVLGAQCRSPLGCDSRPAKHGQTVQVPMEVVGGLEDDAPGAVPGVRSRIHQRHRCAADCTLRDDGNLRSGMNVN